MKSSWGSARRVTESVLRAGLERVHGSGPVLLPEYPRHPRARWGWQGRARLEPVADVLAAASLTYQGEIEAIRELLGWARQIPRNAGPGEACWENDWWGTIDALMQCASLKRRDPKLYLEIGSGFSTAFAARAIADFGLRTEIVSIDTEPRIELGAQSHDRIAQPLEEVAELVLDRVGPGDIVVIDGSHVAMMNSDATVFFLEVMPRLPAGVLVGIDDVFLPWDYPPEWDRRPYGEQYLLAAWLLGGAHGYALRFPAWWVVEDSPLAGQLADVWPLVENRFGRHATSFWVERLEA